MSQLEIPVTTRLSHDALLRTLALHLRDPEKVQFPEPNLNGWAMGGDYGSPDLLEIPKSYSRFVRKVFEVKATQSDLLSDLRADKWLRYLPLCDRMTFAVQDGIDYEKHLRPLPVGIMLYKGGRWRTVRAAPPNQKAQPWPENVWMALLFGRMGVRDSSRLLRMEAEAAILRSQELKELRYSAHQRLAKLAREIESRKDELDRRADALDKRDRATDADHRQRAIENLCRLMGVYTWNVHTEDEIYRKWATQVLDQAAAQARSRLLEPQKEVAPC
jgi:hypothetical protein